MELKSKRNYYFYWGTFLFLMILKYAFYGFKYFPVMDDWIQYGTYSLVNNPFTDLILKTKMYTIRPLAGLTDVYILGKLWNCMGLVFFVFTMMHFVSAYFISNVFRYNGIKIGYVFLIIYGLLPFGSEATYWISASSRILTAIFFTSLALYFLCRYIYDTQKYRDLVVFFFSLLISVGFYESVIIMSFIAVVLIVLPNFKKLHGKIATLIALLPYGIIASYYNHFSSEGQLSGRGALVDADTTKDYNITFDALYKLIQNSDIYFYTKGLYRGFFVILDQRAFVYMGLILIAGIGVYFVSFRAPREKLFFANIKKIIIGVIFFCAPFLIFFPLTFPWIGFRNAFTSFIGLALVVEGISDIFTKDIILKKAKGVVLAIIAMSFVIINISELTDFQSVSNNDKKLCEEILSSSQGTGLYESTKNTYLFNSQHTYSELNKNFHEHINSVTNSPWCLTGALRGLANKATIKNITPVYVNEPIKISPVDYTRFVLLGIENDLQVSLLRIKQIDKYNYRLYRVKGTLYGEIEYKYEHAFFRKTD